MVDNEQDTLYWTIQNKLDLIKGLVGFNVNGCKGERRV